MARSVHAALSGRRAVDPAVAHMKRRAREEKKVLVEQVSMTDAARVHYDMCSGLTNFHGLAQYLQRLYKHFPSLRKITLYRARREALEHHFTLRKEAGVFSSVSIDPDEASIIRADALEMIVRREFRAAVLDRPTGTLLKFTLRPGDFSFEMSRIEPYGRGMK